MREGAGHTDIRPAEVLEPFLNVPKDLQVLLLLCPPSPLSPKALQSALQSGSLESWAGCVPVMHQPRQQHWGSSGLINTFNSI